MSSRTRGTTGVFVDRDGTLIRDVGHLNRLEQVEVLPRVPEAIRLLHDHGLKVAVITNQSAVARGLLTEQELELIHQELRRRLAASGTTLDGIYYCPHHPTEGFDPYRIPCECRKPNVGLATRAAVELNLDLNRSYVVGDQLTDMELAARIGARGILIEAGDTQAARRDTTMGSVLVKDLWEAASWIVQDLQANG